MNKYYFIMATLLMAASQHILANSQSIHISEDSVSQKKSLKPRVANESGTAIFKFSEDNPDGKKTYLSQKDRSSLDPSRTGDAEKLANSIEFEIYETSENHMSHTVFESGAGICHGFNSNDGVDITDSRTYYINKKTDEYYASIAGATVYSDLSIHNLQYAPVFNVQDPNVAKQLQEEERVYGKKAASQHINNSSKMLSNTICR